MYRGKVTKVDTKGVYVQTAEFGTIGPCQAVVANYAVGDMVLLSDVGSEAAPDLIVVGKLTALGSIGGGVYSVMDHGAIGDGVADDTAAFQTTFDLAAANDAIAWIPPGHYRLTDTLTIGGPIVVKSAPLAVMKWEGLTGSTPGISVDFGDVSYNLARLDLPILDGPSHDLTSLTGTALYVANGDIIQVTVQYVVGWKVGIHLDASASNSENHNVRFEVMDRCETGLKMSASGGYYLDICEITGNTIGICKYGVYLEAATSGVVADNIIQVQQIWQEIDGGACVYGSGASGLQRNRIEVQYLRSQSTANTPGGGSFKGPWVAGDQTINSEAGFLAGVMNTITIGEIPPGTDAAAPVRVRVSGFDNNVKSLNRDQESEGGIALSSTQGEANFNGGLPVAANRVVCTATVPALTSGAQTTFYAYNQFLPSEYGVAVNVVPMNDYQHLFSVWAETNTSTVNREIKVKVRALKDTPEWGIKFALETS